MIRYLDINNIEIKENDILEHIDTGKLVIFKSRSRFSFKEILYRTRRLYNYRIKNTDKLIVSWNRRWLYVNNK